MAKKKQYKSHLHLTENEYKGSYGDLNHHTIRTSNGY